MALITTIRTVIWGAAEPENLIRDAVAAAHLEIVAVGGNSSESADLARAFQAPRVDDLRAAIRVPGNELLWLVSTEPLDSEIGKMLREAGIRIITLQPPAGSLVEVNAESIGSAVPVFVPRMRLSPGFRAAREVLPQFGQAQCVNVSFRSGAGEGTLFSRLYDAMDVITSLCDHTQAVNAALAGPLNVVPEQLENLRGHLTVNMRFKSNRCACAALSDMAGSWFRGVTVLGEGGCLRINEGGFDWIDPAGEIVESHPSRDTLSPGRLIGMQIERMVNGMDATEPPPEPSMLLALCEAARLSALTGQDESPSRLMEMMSRP